VNCRVFSNTLKDYIADELTTEQNEMMTKHMSQCEKCKGDYKRQLEVYNSLQIISSVNDITFRNSKDEILTNINHTRYNQKITNKINYFFKRNSLRVFTSAAAVMILVFMGPSISNYLTNPNKSDTLIQTLNRSRGTIDKDDTKEPYIEEQAKDFELKKESPIKPLETKEFKGTAQEVKDYVLWNLKSSNTVPPELKLKFVNTMPGTPVFVKDSRHLAFPEDEKKLDYYLVPLLENNTIVGVCSISIWGNELVFGMLGEYSDHENSVFSKDINKLYDKVLKEKGLKVKNHRLVYNPDYENKLCLSQLDPLYELEIDGGQVIYYSNREVLFDKTEFDKIGKNNKKKLGG
jgi:hypothetical protein